MALDEDVVAKRIILLLDGTWNDADQGPADTNIVRLRERIAAFLADPGRSTLASPSGASRQTFVTSGSKQGSIENVVLYERGVGTSGFLDNLRGSWRGAGSQHPPCVYFSGAEL
ncbi:phospholipase effector Tle1 domain-containing protein [Bradyrhizobium sp. SEMIA]|uniref:phospholipase effector Tle1 domain-containing protein n=1 Tax=Bradyrhizobium sp. SEMIA TaxID=2597515 RepID=UPI003A100918